MTRSGTNSNPVMYAEKMLSRLLPDVLQPEQGAGGDYDCKSAGAGAGSTTLTIALVAAAAVGAAVGAAVSVAVRVEAANITVARVRSGTTTVISAGSAAPAATTASV